MSDQELAARLAALEAENATLQRQLTDLGAAEARAAKAEADLATARADVQSAEARARQAAAEAAQLRAEINAAPTPAQIRDYQDRITALQKALDEATANAVAAEAARRAEVNAEIADLQKRRDQAIADRDAAQTTARKATANADAWSAKFAALYGPVEEGITTGPAPYVVTADNSAHPTLEEARARKWGLMLGIPDRPAAALLRDPAKLKPLVDAAQPGPEHP